ncbi:hypothetical protein EXIGLDRAFT_702317 [Exidia glandulosa HHB12029]|uniref:Uncharacterized protein n=1 Tax=Exidia glandulosa HHB12029 TaxID=1314781 RepID=A0A165LIV5_EXIGL|nr:hypothetical protein EXIGLDRAFT_702317 [Exidia glandulosa HHB12029]
MTVVSGGPITQQLILHQPGPLIECQTSQFSWEGNVGDTGISIYAGAITDGSPLEFLPIVPAALTTTNWLVDQPGSNNYTFLLHDISTGAASSVRGFVAPNPDREASCTGNNPHDLSARGALTTTGAQLTVDPSSGPSSPEPSSSKSHIPPPTASAMGFFVTVTSPTPRPSSLSNPNRSDIFGPIVDTAGALLIIGGIGFCLYTGRRKRNRMRSSESLSVPALSGEIERFARAPMQSAPKPVAQRAQQTMGAEEAEPSVSVSQPEPLAALREENAVLGEENAVLRAVIARMQTSIPAPGDSETLPSYESRSTHSG